MSSIDETTRLLDSSRTQPATEDENPRSASHSDIAVDRIDTASSPSTSPSSSRVWQIVPVLLLGVFLANADTSLIVAASQKIASEFHALSDASWLITGYGLASCAFQPLYGKLSDIFGRKANLIVSYGIFASGCSLCAFGPTLWLVVLGRAISGIGGAGMTALVSVVIADIVPTRQVAAWRSYVNIVATAARALGAPLGGWFTDMMGWRMAFFVQVPLTVLAMILVAWRLPSITVTGETGKSPGADRFKRVDILGALTLVGTIVSLLLALDLAAKEAPWWQIAITAGLCVKLLMLFYYVEKYRAIEPILSIALMGKRDVATTYLISLTQQAAQFGIFYAVPIYFQIVAHASVASTGLSMLPAVVGNALGGVVAGVLISRNGRYMKLSVAGTVIAMTGYVLVAVRWTGSTRWWEVLYLLPAGFGTGIILSTTFVHLTASLEHDEIAIAGTMLYCIQTMGVLLGIQILTTVLHAELRKALSSALRDVSQRRKTIEDAVSDIALIWEMPESIRQIVTKAYVESLRYTYGVTIAFSAVAFLASLTLREKRI